MAKQQRKKLPKLEQIKKKIKGKVYVGNQIEKMKQEIDSLSKQKDSLSKQKDSLQRKTQDQQKEIDSLKQVIKVRVK